MSEHNEIPQRTLFLDESRRLRTAYRVVLYFVAFLAVNLVIGGIVIAVLLGWKSSTEPGFEVGQAMGDRQFLMLAQILATAPITLVLLGVTWLFRRHLDRRTMSSMGMGRPAAGWPLTLTAGTVAGAFPIAAGVGLVWALDGYGFTGVGAAASTWALFPVLVFAAFQEELVFRGYILQNMIDVGHPRWGVFVSSLVFWLLHGGNPAAWSSPLVPINLFGAGVLLALAYRASGDLWFPTVLHFAWNATQGVVFQLPISGITVDGFIDVEILDTAPSWLTGGSFGPEASIWATGVEVVLIAIFIEVLRRKGPDEPAARSEPVAAGTGVADDATV